MKIVFDTTFLVAIDRRNPEAIALAKKLTQKNVEFWISSITVAEIMTGALLSSNTKQAQENARNALTQFDWQDFNASIAMKTGELLAYHIAQGTPVPFQDLGIAATALELKADYFCTENTKHFKGIPFLKNKVLTLKELKKKIT